MNRLCVDKVSTIAAIYTVQLVTNFIILLSMQNPQEMHQRAQFSAIKIV